MTKLNESLTFPNGTTISNRFVMPPMLTNSGKDGYATSDTVNYYQARSQAGGMIITEYMYVSENGGPAMTWQNDREQLAVYDDRFVPQLAKVAAAIKQSGDKAIMQIAHTGREANYRAMTERPVYAPSAIDYPFLPYRVHEFTDAQIKQVIADFGAAVKRAVDAGFDGVEIHGANHYLIQQFFSQYSNRRTDHWGDVGKADELPSGRCSIGNGGCSKIRTTGVHRWLPDLTGRNSWRKRWLYLAWVHTIDWSTNEGV